MFKEKKLYKSSDKKISGVCAGIAEFFEIDPTIVRVAYALIALFTAAVPCIIVYAILAFVIPESPFPDYQYNEFEQNKTDGNNQ
ncbi:MAG: PspC domain-containing protein [Clostridia bacterium]|nr:PspC domain-containing protein [Clostridia bacterium]